MAEITLSQTLQSATLGTVEKAQIYVNMPRNLASAVPGKTDKANETEQALENGAGNTAFSALSNQCKLTVQYNPSSISFEANAKTTNFSVLQQGTSPNVPQQNSRPPRVVMSVELIFDDVNPADAFWLSRPMLVPDVLKAGAVACSDRVYSVQTETNAFVALLLRPETRTVTFAWADLSFTGRVSEVQAEYVMFSRSGRPIRSKVHLRLAQNIEEKSDQDSWSGAIDKIFSGSNMFYGEKPAQALGGILNIDAF